MTINIPRGQTDQVMGKIQKALELYQAKHPQAKIDLYRWDRVSVRIRIIDPQFAGKGRADRSRYVWDYLETLPDDVQGEISMVLLLTPDEVKTSFANMEFEDPVPSEL